ncbi:MAG TPA: hypothetical protein VIF62_21400 [Labilithrix sp.]|jgi:hypothetical protein
MKLPTSLLASSLALVVAACSAAPAEPSDSDESDLSGSACAGDACASLTTPQALVRGGIVAAGHQLWWIAAGTTKDANGVVIDELQRCDLPACTTVKSSLPLVSDGLAFDASDLRAAGANVLLAGWKQDGNALSLFLTDGATLVDVVDGVSDQHDKYAVDEKGLLVYTEDRRTDGWARSSLRMCAFDGLALAKACATYADASLNGISGIALTPTRVVVEESMSGRSFDRTTLGDPRGEAMFSDEGVAEVASVGESFVSSELVVDTRDGRVEHDTTLRTGGSNASAQVNGVLQASATDGTRFFVGTAGEGDVFERSGTGVLAKFYPKSGRVYVRATGQDVRSVTWDDKQLYWLDEPSTGATPIGDSPGIVRTVAR